MQTISWKDVVAIHNSQCGISTKNGAVRSLLCNQGKDGYADEVRENEILYRVTSSTHPKSVATLRGMAGLGKPVHVFEKLAVNQWIDHGNWFVHDFAAEDDGEVFHLKRTRM